MAKEDSRKERETRFLSLLFIYFKENSPKGGSPWPNLFPSEDIFIIFEVNYEKVFIDS